MFRKLIFIIILLPATLVNLGAQQLNTDSFKLVLASITEPIKKIEAYKSFICNQKNAISAVISKQGLAQINKAWFKLSVEEKKLVGKFKLDILEHDINFYLQNGEMKNAIDLQEILLSSSVQTKDTLAIIQVAQKLSENYLNMKDLQKSFIYASTCYQFSKKKKDTTGLLFATKRLYEFYKSRGNDKGLIIYEEYLALNNDINLAQQNKKLDNAQQEKQLKLQYKLDSLNKISVENNQRFNLEVAASENKILFMKIIIAILLAFCCLFGLFILRRVKKIKSIETKTINLSDENRKNEISKLNNLITEHELNIKLNNEAAKQLSLQLNQGKTILQKHFLKSFIFSEFQKKQSNQIYWLHESPTVMLNDVETRSVFILLFNHKIQGSIGNLLSIAILNSINTSVKDLKVDKLPEILKLIQESVIMINSTDAPIHLKESFNLSAVKLTYKKEKMKVGKIIIPVGGNIADSLQNQNNNAKITLEWSGTQAPMSLTHKVIESNMTYELEKNVEYKPTVLKTFLSTTYNSNTIELSKKDRVYLLALESTEPSYLKLLESIVNSKSKEISVQTEDLRDHLKGLEETSKMDATIIGIQL